MIKKPISAINMSITTRCFVLALFATCANFTVSCTHKPQVIVPPKMYVFNQRAAAYLSPQHRIALERSANNTPGSAAELTNYYTFCIEDEEKAKYWRGVYDRLVCAPNDKQPQVTKRHIPPSDFMDSAYRARQGSAADARNIANYYLIDCESEVNALPWMELAAQLGDVEAQTYVVRLKVLLGVMEFSKKNVLRMRPRT
jgi:hypothetical protein